MVKSFTIGILGVQGAVSEHAESTKNALKQIKDINGKIEIVKDKRELKNLDALIIPGGESTTISRILNKSDLYDYIFKRIQDDSLYIMGTCAGCVLLAKEIDGDKNNGLKLLNAMDMKVERNAFGRQRESFEQNIDIKGLDSSYKAVFIRAPIIKKTWGKCEILAKINEKIIAARQDMFLALSFHPELAQDIRIHKYFLEMIF